MESLARWLGWPMLSHFSDSIMHVIYWRPVSSSPIIIRQQSSIITDHCKTIRIFWKFLKSIWLQMPAIKILSPGSNMSDNHHHHTIIGANTRNWAHGFSDIFFSCSFVTQTLVFGAFGAHLKWFILWTKTYVYKPRKRTLGTYMSYTAGLQAPATKINWNH